MKKYKFLKENLFFDVGTIISEKKMKMFFTQDGIDYLLDGNIEEVKENESLEKILIRFFADEGLFGASQLGRVAQTVRDHENKRYLECFDSAGDKHIGCGFGEHGLIKHIRKALESLKDEE